MSKIEIEIGGQQYVLRGEETEDHLREVADLVKKRVAALRKKTPTLSLQKASILAAFDFASQVIKGSKKSADYKSAVLTKAKLLLDRVETELSSH